MKHLLIYILYFISTIAALASGLFVYLIWLQTPFFFPKPSGPYAIGIKTYHWVDAQRKETLSTDEKNQNRELMVTIWFPAQGKTQKKPKTPYATYFVDYVKRTQKIAWLKLGLARPIYTYAQPNMQISCTNTTYPIIIFSHGYLCTNNSNTAQCEELASHGYIVIGINHTYDSCVTQFPDGRIIDGEKSMAQRLPINTLKNRFHQRDQEIEIWTADVQFVIKKLEQLNIEKESPFYQRLDLLRIGMFGHSFGGSTTVQICQKDHRVKAGVNLDWGLHGTKLTQKCNTPFMFILSEDIKEFDQPWDQHDWKKFGVNSQEEEKLLKYRRLIAVNLFALSNKKNRYTFIVNNAKHMTFCDWALLKHASLFSRFFDNLGAGSIDGFRATKIINDYLVNFFDKYLKNQKSELLDGKSINYPEVETKNWA